MRTSELKAEDGTLDWAVAKCLLPESWNDAEIILSDETDYSTNWAAGGPIIEQESIEFDYDEVLQVYTAANGIQVGQGKTHLIAAMRCYVASKIGDEIEIPEELK